MLSIDTCHDIEKYEEAVFAGMNAKKTQWGLLGVAVGVVFGFIFYFALHCPLVLCVYAGTPFTAVIIFIGTYEKDGLSCMKILKKKFAKDKNKPICHVSTETYDRYIKVKDSSIPVSEDNDAEFERIKKLIIKGAVIAIIAVIVIVALIVMFVIKGRVQ